MVSDKKRIKPEQSPEHSLYISINHFHNKLQQVWEVTLEMIDTEMSSIYQFLMSCRLND